MNASYEITEKISGIYKGGILLCTLQAGHGDHHMKQVHLLYRLRQVVHITNADFVAYTKMNAFVCHR